MSDRIRQSLGLTLAFLPGAFAATAARLELVRLCHLAVLTANCASKARL